MRVAVRHTDKEHPNHHWFAFEQGRILGFTDPRNGETLSPPVVAEALLARAKTQFPEDAGYEHRVETLHATGVDTEGHETSGWYPAGDSDLPRAGHGALYNHDLEASQGQEGSST